MPVTDWERRSWVRNNTYTTKTSGGYDRRNEMSGNHDSFALIINGEPVFPDQLPDDVERAASGSISTYADYGHPFTPVGQSMIAVRERRIDEFVLGVEDLGYAVEVVDETGFCFAPQPTVGEVRLTDAR